MGVTRSSVLRPVNGALTQAGNIVELFVDVARNTFKRPFQFREFIEQAWFIASVTILPTAMVAIPFGAVVSL
ncbi:ABC transporter permease, partial [Streptomyces sp. NPDC127092]